MISKLQGVRIAGVASAVPSLMRTLEETAAATGTSEQEAVKIAKMTGVQRRFFAAADTCSSDLCFEAAKKLLAELNWERESIDALLFVTQTPDYNLPATACILQERLKLSSACAALDVSLGCSGYVYGLWTASCLVANGGTKRVLLLVGDTSNRICSPHDRATAFIFGDAGTATALEYDPQASPMTFALGTDGRGADFLIRRGDGLRHSFPNDSLNRPTDEDGTVRGHRDLFMDGAEVFSFTLERVPPLIQSVLEESAWSSADIEYLVPHQANLFMLQHLAKRMKLPMEKVVISLDEFGNTSCASIPLAINHRLREKLQSGDAKLVLAGFGVGWSWGAVALQAGPLVLPEIVHLTGSAVENAA